MTTSLDPLAKACMAGNTATIQELLHKSDASNEPTQDKSTATEASLLTVSSAVNKMLLWQDSKEQEFTTPPLFIVVDYGHLDAVNLLVKSGADVHARDENDYTPLHWAILSGNVTVVRQLIEQHDAVVDHEALSLAREGNTDDDDDENNKTNEEKMASRDNRKAMEQLLLDNIDLYAGLEGDDDAILDKACREGDTKKVRKMIDEGYDWQRLTDNDGKYLPMSPVFLAYKFGHVEIVSIFAELSPQGMEL